MAITKPKPLIIVESPTKARTISRFMKSRYQVMASLGHVRDLPKSTLGVDVENDFAPLIFGVKGNSSKDSGVPPKRRRSFILLLTLTEKARLFPGIFATSWGLIPVKPKG